MTDVKRPTTIGPQTIVSFPKLAAQNVPAKVDTGADSSSIWASNIKERAGKLSFTLFAPGSPYYTGEVITTKDYQLRSVKNSFGVAEFRYKVRLNMVVEGRTINVRFTLSNRSENRYPVLIGRRTLHGRFVVDVSRNRNKNYEVLVIRSSRSNTTSVSKKFFSDLKKTNKKIKFTFTSLEELNFMVSELGNKICIQKSGKDIAEFDLVYFRVINSDHDIAAVAAEYLKRKGIPFTDRLMLSYGVPVSKLYQYFTLNRTGIKVPKSIFITSARLPRSYTRIKKEIGVPFILKDIYGKKGRNLFLIKDKDGFNKACQKAKDRSVNLIAQEFITHEGHYRILVFGKRVEMIMFLTHRMAEPRLTQKNNNENIKPKLVSEQAVPGSVKKASILAASSLCIDIAGVDMVQDKETGLWYCLEVNENPQLVTGSFIKEKELSFTDYLTRTLGQ